MPAPFATLLEFADRVVRLRSFGPRLAEMTRAEIIATYEAHNDDVRAGVPADRLLVFDVAEGWEPLCGFLGVPVPPDPFPNMNDREQFQTLFGVGDEHARATHRRRLPGSVPRGRRRVGRPHGNREADPRGARGGRTAGRHRRPFGSFASAAAPEGPVRRLLRGEWLGHPLHPLLTDLPIGFWTSATMLDLLGGRRARPAATTMVGLGVLSAVPTVASGLAEYTTLDSPQRRVAVVHAGANAVATALYARSWSARRRDRHGAASRSRWPAWASRRSAATSEGTSASAAATRGRSNRRARGLLGRRARGLSGLIRVRPR